MKLTYDRETDSLYIELAETPVVDSRPLSDGVVGDFSSEGTLVGLDIEHAAQRVDLDRFVHEGVPVRSAKVA